MRRMFDDVRATPAVPTPPRHTRAERIVTLAPPEEEEGEGEDSEDEESREEGGPGPPENVSFLYLSCLFLFFPFYRRLRGEGERVALL